MTCPVMYCASCQDTLSSHCLMISTHQTHRWVTLKDAEKKQLEDIKKRYSKLECKVSEHEIENQVSAAKQKIEVMYEKTKKSIADQYEELWKLLENNKKYACFILEAERDTQESSLNQLEMDAENCRIKTAKILEGIQGLTKQQKTENRDDQLDKLMALEINLKTIEKVCSFMKEKTPYDARLRALEKIVKNIMQKNKELLPRPWEFSEAVTFNKNRTDDELEVSEDADQIILKRFSAYQLKKYKTPWFSAVAAQSYSKGQHYWEVMMEDKGSWAVGIMEKGRMEKCGKQLNYPLGRDGASWILESDEGELTALHKSKSIQVRDCSVHRLGVYVDYNKGQVKIFNVLTGSMLHSFSPRFKNPVCPVFSLKAKTSSTAQLKLCKIEQDIQHYPHQDVQTSDRVEGSDSGVESEEAIKQSQ